MKRKFIFPELSEIDIYKSAFLLNGSGEPDVPTESDNESGEVSEIDIPET